MKDRIKLLRKELGLNQGEFASKIEVSQGSITAWERGAPIPQSRIQAICREFHARREWLETGAGEMFDPPSDITKEQARQAQEKFVIDVFNLLTEEQQRVVIETLSKIQPGLKNSQKTQHVEISGDVGGNVNVEQK